MYIPGLPLRCAQWCIYQGIPLRCTMVGIPGYTLRCVQWWVSQVYTSQVCTMVGIPGVYLSDVYLRKRMVCGAECNLSPFPVSLLVVIPALVQHCFLWRDCRLFRHCFPFHCWARILSCSPVSLLDNVDDPSPVLTIPRSRALRRAHS